MDNITYLYAQANRILVGAPGYLFTTGKAVAFLRQMEYNRTYGQMENAQEKELG